MVSPTPSTTQKPPVLSYADRAKNARNINLQTPLVTRVQSQTVSVSPTAVAPAASVAVPNPIPQSDTSQAPPIGTTNHHPPQQVQSTSSSAEAEPAPKESTEFGPQHVNSSSTVPSDHIQKASTAPAINVWHLRKEQMALARANLQPQIHQTSPVARSQGPREPSSSRASEASSASDGSTNAGPVSLRGQNVNGSGLDGQHYKALTPNAQRSQNSVAPTVADTTSWPTVGMSLSVSTTPQQPPNSDNDSLGAGKAAIAEVKEEDKNGAGATTKKNEKPRWVQMSREELQAAADEHRHRSSQTSTGRSRSRPSQQHTQSRHSQGSKPASGSVSNAGSGQNSQGQSRTHSTAGNRTQQANPSSTSHSQAESLVGSVQSSPRRQSSSRGARRLPDDGIPKPNVDSAGSRNRSIRSSRAPSPQASGRSIRAADAPRSAASDAANGNPQLPLAVDNSRSYLVPNHLHGEPYYSIAPPLSASSSQPHSYHSTHASNSPVASPYTLPHVTPPSNMYPSPPPNIPGYAGAPPYPMYPQYDFPQYGQPQSYIPWVTSGQGQGPNVYPVASQYHHPHSLGHQSGYSPASMPVTNISRDMQQHESMPPPTMMSRPPPPGQSEGVAGYREVGFFSPSRSAHLVAAEGSEPDASASRGRQAREFNFGTIKHTVANKTPSPPPTSRQDPTQDESAIFPEAENVGQGGEGGEKSFPVFSIGLNPGEAGPSRIRSKTHPKSAGTSHERGNTAPARLGPSHSAVDEGDTDRIRDLAEESHDAQTSVIDLTDSVMPTWEFGTTKQSNGDETRSFGPTPTELPLPVAQLNGAGVDYIDPVATPTANALVGSHVDVVSSLPSSPRSPRYVPRTEAPSLSIGIPNGLPPQTVHSPSAPYSQPGVSMISPSSEGRMNDEWEVKNFGYGFGRGGSGGSAPPMGGRMDRERDFFPREYNPGRPRRGSYGGGYGGGGHERGGFAARRGRGVTGGYGGRGFGGRNAARGGYQQGQSQRPPFTAMQQPAANPAEAGYYAPPPPQGTTFFHPLGYDYAAYPYTPLPMTTPTTSQTAPPVPTPQSLISFPLDPTRYYLLGQLEYYLSAQNLAQDFYLRQRMDSRGWISIPLIASFNRIKQLTMDLQLVKDVLTLSSLVEVHGDFVRVRSWPQYVLPTASQSIVEDEYTYQSYAHPEYEEAVSSASGEQESTSHDGDEEDLSEEEVEFVMGKEAHGTWTPERSTVASTTT